MRMLLELDENNYSDTTKTHERFAVRGVICRDGKYAMQQARDGFYKILGGGIDKGETHEDAVVREVQEEFWKSGETYTSLISNTSVTPMYTPVM